MMIFLGGGRRAPMFISCECNNKTKIQNVSNSYQTNLDSDNGKTVLHCTLELYTEDVESANEHLWMSVETNWNQVPE